MSDLSNNDSLAALRRVPCEVYSRIVGYLRPVRDWNRGKQQEFSERKTYDIRSARSDEVAQEPKP
jgi:anaerobic ribonucleoside-triphosphate reductase